MTPLTAAAPLKPAFADPVFDSQATFRRLMAALAHAGRRETLDRLRDAPAPLFPATAALCLTLTDFETPLWLDAAAGSDAVRDYLKFHCGAPLVETAAAARFAVIADPASMPRFSAFDAGSEDYPDRSATLIIQVPSLTEGPERIWTGPGIRGSATSRIAGLPDWFWDDWRLERELYPRGLDVFFVADDTVIGLPRSIKVEG